LSDARSSLRALVADSPGFDTAASRPLTLSDMFAPKKNPDAQLEAARYHQVQQIQLETFRKMLATAPSAQASEPLSRPAMPSASSLAPTAPWAPMTAPPAFNQGFPTAPANGGGISFPGAAGAAPAPPSPPPSKLTPPQPIFSVPQRRF
jgi:hypothetical protein